MLTIESLVVGLGTVSFKAGTMRFLYRLCMRVSCNIYSTAACTCIRATPWPATDRALDFVKPFRRDIKGRFTHSMPCPCQVPTVSCPS